MIHFDNVSFTYPDASRPTLRSLNLKVQEGSLSLVVGPTGSGKTTLLGTVSGFVPRFTGGRLEGSVTVNGRATSAHRLKEMADLIGMVHQNPSRGFTTETVESELAYTMEQLGVEPQAMRKRVEETLDLLGLATLRNRRLSELSGGEAQRVAIGSVLTAHPRVLVLDEPTSALDPVAAEEVLATIVRLVHDLGLTVLMAEHRLERVVHYADVIAAFAPDGSVSAGDPSTVMEHSPLSPPVVELSRAVGWSPPAMSVRDARRLAPRLRTLLPSDAPRVRTEPGAGIEPSHPVVDAQQLTVTYGDVVAVRSLDLGLRSGAVTAIMGRNGSGKSSLLWALQGSGRRRSGRVEVGGVDPAGLEPVEARRLVALVPQNASDLLYLDSVGEECDRSDSQAAAPPGTCAAILSGLVPGLDHRAHPADLSEGQQLGLVLAIQMTARPRALLLDEPTRGLDYLAKRRLGAALADMATSGVAIVVATHDVEFVAEHAQRVVVLAEGEIVADGSTFEVVTSSPAFAPQVAKILSPAQYLTVADVVAALGDTR